MEFPRFSQAIINDRQKVKDQEGQEGPRSREANSSVLYILGFLLRFSACRRFLALWDRACPRSTLNIFK